MQKMQNDLLEIAKIVNKNSNKKIAKNCNKKAKIAKKIFPISKFYRNFS